MYSPVESPGPAEIPYIVVALELGTEKSKRNRKATVTLTVVSWLNMLVTSKMKLNETPGVVDLE